MQLMFPMDSCLLFPAFLKALKILFFCICFSSLVNLAASSWPDALPVPRYETGIREGVSYGCFELDWPKAGVAQRIHLLHVAPDTKVKTSLSRLPEQPGALAPLARQADDVQALAAINGTFFDTQTLVTTCTLRIGGKVLMPDRHPDEFREYGGVGIDAQGGMELLIKGVPAWNDLARFPSLMAGGPVLIHRGKAYDQDRNPHDRWRHARTVVATAPDGSQWWAVVDGYQAGAQGMTYAEAGEWMKSLGCREALNLDGGRSSGMWIRSPHQKAWSAEPGMIRLNYPLALPNAILLLPGS